MTPFDPGLLALGGAVKSPPPKPATTLARTVLLSLLVRGGRIVGLFLLVTVAIVLLAETGGYDL
ncbi:hypothetical protein [Fodinicurvata sp. EGI_FJ10296]|uniref:hypothetical protein n=1 Tax=Fodinicurvata sp. EGI_FJ10296 TaxID=3231908 RepID=UPI003452E39D